MVSFLILFPSQEKFLHGTCPWALSVGILSTNIGRKRTGIKLYWWWKFIGVQHKQCGLIKHRNGCSGCAVWAELIYFLFWGRSTHSQDPTKYCNKNILYTFVKWKMLNEKRASIHICCSLTAYMLMLLMNDDEFVWGTAQMVLSSLCCDCCLTCLLGYNVTSLITLILMCSTKCQNSIYLSTTWSIFVLGVGVSAVEDVNHMFHSCTISNNVWNLQALFLSLPLFLVLMITWRIFIVRFGKLETTIFFDLSNATVVHVSSSICAAYRVRNPTARSSRNIPDLISWHPPSLMPSLMLMV